MSDNMLNLRARTKKGIIKIQSLSSTSTIHELKNSISELTGIELPSIKILRGYPPKQLDNSNENTTLSSNQIKDGEMFTVEESSGQNESITSNKCKQDSKNISKGSLLRKIVPANNSCLFTSINYVMQENGRLDLDCQKSMRELIAKTVKNDQVFYSEAILGKKNSAYCDWIKDWTSWGGSIEIMILSKYYSIEICVVDIRTGRVDKFGEDQNYPQRVFIIYDGIHFDPLHLETRDGKIKTKFSTKDENDDFVLGEAIGLAIEAKNAKQFTDIANFKLRCLCCQQPLKGQKQAQEHAEKYGHINFGEI